MASGAGGSLSPARAVPPHTLAHPHSLFVQYKKVDPVGSRVVVEVDKAESTSLGGILLPTAAQVRKKKGEA